METKRILIADDDKNITRLLSVVLDEAGYKVLVAVDAYMALDLAVKEKPDLVLLDVNMPCGNGLSVLERIRKIHALHNTPVMFLTGVKTQAVHDKAEQLGAAAVVYKPVDSSELLSTIKQVLAAVDRAAEAARAAQASKVTHPTMIG